ncbi:hypothetical protein VS86_00219 [Vibrio cholerae]|nr:hypothetical protein VS86_00219 [Vibrio cholerae]
MPVKVNSAPENINAPITTGNEYCPADAASMTAAGVDHAVTIGVL